MSLPDSAEYWWDIKTPWHNNIFKKRKHKRNIPEHDCKPRGGEPGTYKRRFCKVCGKAFSKTFIRLNPNIED